MFKLGKNDDDFDLEEDFLQEVFVNRIYKSHLTKSVPVTHSHKPCPVQSPKFVLSERASDSNVNSKKSLVCQNERSAHPKKDISTVDTLTVENHKNALDDFQDIDWDLCFEENDLNQKPIGEPNYCSEGVFAKKISDVQPSDVQYSSCEVKNENLHTTTCSTPKAITPVSASHSGRKRKFPGPAGLLPTLPKGTFQLSMDSLISEDSNNESALKEINDSMLLSQISDNPFESEPWIRMQQDLDINGQDSHALRKYNISWVRLKAAAKQLPEGKIPILIVVLKSILETRTDASVIFKDETGEMPGTIHRQVLEEYGEDLSPGAVLVIRRVFVFSPSARKHYLMVTPSSMVCLYSPIPHKPKSLAKYITDLHIQVREFALESWMTPERNKFGSVPSGSLGNSCQAAVQAKPVQFVTTKLKAETKQTPPLVEEDFIQDDELDKLFEEMESGS